ncbi:hypothetical protein EW146_g5472 [Bondarzewia mesenterica]|uniref:Uncharacterized protein n=1 Tax=Bondarzewia mesenterica TaxID=1095465 RepID=A0A4S4LX59_9AGAM|nr:hypothetical protein EW146_g5472 [Bondarzewia mesenterica]
MAPESEIVLSDSEHSITSHSSPQLGSGVVPEPYESSLRINFNGLPVFSFQRDEEQSLFDVDNPDFWNSSGVNGYHSLRFIPSYLSRHPRWSAVHEPEPECSLRVNFNGPPMFSSKNEDDSIDVSNPNFWVDSGAIEVPAPQRSLLSLEDASADRSLENEKNDKDEGDRDRLNDSSETLALVEEKECVKTKEGPHDLVGEVQK